MAQKISMTNMPLLRRLVKGAPSRVFTILLLIMLCIFALIYYYTMGMERSIVISGNTEVAKIKLTREARWSFANIILCGPIPRTRSSAQASPDKSRDGAGCQSSHKLGEGRGTIIWPVGASVSVKRRATGAMEFFFEILADDPELTARANLNGTGHQLLQRSRLIVPKQGAIDIGALDFVGGAVFGHSVSQGTNAIFVSGEYEIREQLPFRNSLELTRSGHLFRGDKVSISDSEKENDEIGGFISAPGPEDTGFYFVASATSKNSSGNQRGINLRVTRHGGVPVSIGTRWTDRALSDSLTLAISVILGALAVLVTIFVEFYALFRTKKNSSL